jgi:hypothetical protein
MRSAPQSGSVDQLIDFLRYNPARWVWRKSVGNFSLSAPCAVPGAGFPLKRRRGRRLEHRSPIVLRYTPARFFSSVLGSLEYNQASFSEAMYG